MLLGRPLRRLIGAVRHVLGQRPGGQVTVIIGVRNRFGSRLQNALLSLRMQDYSQKDIQVLVVDYGSELRASQEVVAQCAQFGATVVHVSGVQKWNRSHCLNIGIRCASTPYVLLSDVDVIFPPTFLTTAVQRLRLRPLAVVKSSLCNMPRETEKLELPAEPEAYRLSVAHLLEQTKARDAEGQASILLLERRLLLSMRGLDEFYEGWGFEDIDLYNRLMWYGVEFCNISDAAPLLHQWHPPYEGVNDSTLEETKERNRRYFQIADTLTRNRGGWGSFGSNSVHEPPRALEPPGDEAESREDARPCR
jgi:hypothetical protein